MTHAFWCVSQNVRLRFVAVASSERKGFVLTFVVAVTIVVVVAVAAAAVALVFVVAAVAAAGTVLLEIVAA